MKKIKLHKRLALLLLLSMAVYGCNKKSFPSNSNSTDDSYNTAAAVNAAALPPQVITIPDEKAKTTKDGEVYYDDTNGYRYWRYNDGKYYLDRTHDSGTNKKKIKKAKRAASENQYITNN